MRVVSLAKGASEWLALLDPDPEWMLVPASLDGPTPDVLVVTEEAPRVPDAWLTADGPPRVVTWNPTTLKSVMDNALRLARYTDRLPQLMRILGEKERSMRILQEQIGIGVLAGDRDLSLREQRSGRPPVPSVACLFFDGHWRIMGRWMPDLIDRAGGTPLFLDPGDPPIAARPSDFMATAPDVVFIAAGRDDGSEPSFLDLTLNFLDEISFSGRAYLVPSAKVFSSGPGLYDTVSELAGALYPHYADLCERQIPLSRIR